MFPHSPDLLDVGLGIVWRLVVGDVPVIDGEVEELNPEDNHEDIDDYPDY